MPKINTVPASLKIGQQRAIGVENELHTRLSHNSAKHERPSDSLFRMIAGKIGRENHYDSGAIEFTTHPIRISYAKSKTGYKEVSQYFERLKSITEVSRTNGTHIHISILREDHPLLEVRVLVIATAFYRQLQKIAGRETHWAQRANLREVSIDGAVEWLGTDRFNRNVSYRGRSGTILGPSRYQTLEFRGPKGTNDYEEILAWTELLENIVRVSNRKVLKTLSLIS